MRRLRIALLHLVPRVGDLEYNRQLVKTALTSTAGLGAAWVVTPELWLYGVNVGILICADAYTPPLARRLQAQGAQLLVSSAAWDPWPHGPDGSWEERTRETGLPLFVCNRTGQDQTLSLMDAESVVIKDGQRLVSFQASRSAIVLVDWVPATQDLIGEAQIVYL
jgi:predicted amidohydrolase